MKSYRKGLWFEVPSLCAFVNMTSRLLTKSSETFVRLFLITEQDMFPISVECLNCLQMLNLCQIKMAWMEFY